MASLALSEHWFVLLKTKVSQPTPSFSLPHWDHRKPKWSCTGQALTLRVGGNWINWGCFSAALPAKFLSLLKHSGPLKSCVSVVSPNPKDQQTAGHSLYAKPKMPFLFTNFVKTKSSPSFLSLRSTGTKVEGRASQRKETKFAIANVTVYLIH